MSPKELAELLKQNPEQLRVWAVEFAHHLSKSAAPNEIRKHRSYDANDISIMALVADYKDRGLPNDAIHKALDDGERLMPSITPAGAGQQNKELALQNRITELENQLAAEKQKSHESDLARAAAEGREKLLRELLAEANTLLRAKGQG